MAIDLGTSNTTRYHSVPDHADFTLPDGDWAWVALAQVAASANPRYLISTNTLGGANAFNLLISSTNRVGVQVNTGALLETFGSPLSDKWMWMYATRRSGFLYAGYISLSGSASETAGQAISGTSNGTLLYIGARNDLNTARFWQGEWSQVALVSGSGITAAQAAELASGAPLLGMPFASQIKFLLHGRTANDTTITDLIGGKVATRNGSSYGTNEEDAQTPYIWLPNYIRRVESSGSAVTGTLAVTNANDTIAASGTTTITGSLAATNQNDTLAASGSPVVAGSLATTNADDTLSATGAVGSAVTGTLAVTNADDTVAATGTTTVNGALAYTNANDTLAATGSTTVTGTLAATNTDDTLAASGTVESVAVTGTLDVVNADDTVAASGTTKILGTLAYTNSNDTLSAFGTVNNGVMVESALITGIATSTGIKKPGIPENAPAWLRTTLEILEGRRGNRVTIPAEQTLTFSATPTQAECEALYEYTNEIRTALSSIISRFDS